MNLRGCLSGEETPIRQPHYLLPWSKCFCFIECKNLLRIDIFIRGNRCIMDVSMAGSGPIKGQRLGHKLLQLPHPCIIRWVCAQELRRTFPACCRHPFPEWDGFAWVVTSHGSKYQPILIRFCFLLARPWQHGPNGTAYAIRH